MLSDEGETYFFNDDTGESQWDPPGASESSIVVPGSELSHQASPVGTPAASFAEYSQAQPAANPFMAEGSEQGARPS